VSSVGKSVKDVIGVFLNLVLDVHLSSILVFLLTRKSVVKFEVIGVLLQDLLPFVIVQEGIRVGNSKEQPGSSLVGVSGGGVFSEKTTDETTVGGNSGSGGNHDVVSVRLLLGHKHNLSGRSGHVDLISGLGITQEVRADSLLGWVISLQLRAPIGGTTDTERSSLSGHVISVTGRGDGVETDRVGLSVLLTDTWGDNSPGLSLPVGEVTVVVDDDVASFSSSLGSDNALGRDNLSGEGSLVLVNIYRNSGLVPVRLGFKEILLGGKAVVLLFRQVYKNRQLVRKIFQQKSAYET